MGNGLQQANRMFQWQMTWWGTTAIVCPQELWTLEKQRADLASETERVKQDNEFMEGEITTLRATVTEQMQQVTALKVRHQGGQLG
jgi:hypothetical protein